MTTKKRMQIQNLFEKVLKSNGNNLELQSLLSAIDDKLFSDESITLTKGELLSLFHEFSEELANKVVDTAFNKHKTVETEPKAKTVAKRRYPTLRGTRLNSRRSRILHNKTFLYLIYSFNTVRKKKNVFNVIPPPFSRTLQ
jgi:hypothetical protein